MQSCNDSSSVKAVARTGQKLTVIAEIYNPDTSKTAQHLRLVHTNAYSSSSDARQLASVLLRSSWR